MKPNEERLSHDYLINVLEYSPDTGIFKWTKSVGPRAVVGRVAGTSTTEGYLTIQINNSTYLCHRLAWFYAFEEWPLDELDHINRIGSDNRLDNLRKVSNLENAKTKGMYSSNTSGFKGVTKKGSKWQAVLTYNSQKIYIGRFATAAEASEAYELRKKEILHENSYHR